MMYQNFLAGDSWFNDNGITHYYCLEIKLWGGGYLYRSHWSKSYLKMAAGKVMKNNPAALSARLDRVDPNTVDTIWARNREGQSVNYEA